MNFKQVFIAFITAIFLSTLSGCVTLDQIYTELDNLNAALEGQTDGTTTDGTYYDDSVDYTDEYGNTYTPEEFQEYMEELGEDGAAPRDLARPDRPRGPHAGPDRGPRDRMHDRASPDGKRFAGDRDRNRAGRDRNKAGSRDRKANRHKSKAGKSSSKHSAKKHSSKKKKSKKKK